MDGPYYFQNELSRSTIKDKNAKGILISLVTSLMSRKMMAFFTSQGRRDRPRD